MNIRPAAIWSALLACLLTVLALATPAAGASPPRSTAQASPAPPRAQHVVVVGLSGLRWSDVSAARTPALWRLAGQGSVGNLVDYAVLPLTCPADGWLTLNAGARAQSDHTNAACGAFPAVQPEGAGASVPGLPALETYNHRFHNTPDWGLLAARTPGCATAVGPGAALALADRAGHVASYLPAPDQVTAAVLARCPLTVVDLGTLGSAERSAELAAADTQLARIAAALPADTTLLVTAPGAPSKPPHLQLALADGPGYSAGLLNAASTRQPGLVVLTDLTPTVLGWLGETVPPQTVGAHITRGDRGSLASTVQDLTGRDTAEQVWRDTHDEFFWAYALADAAVLGAIGLAFRGAAEDKRRRRARWWRVAGVFAAAVPVGTFLASLVPWSTAAHPAAWLYSVSVALAVVIALAALLGFRNRDPLAPFGAICLFTLAVLGIDVMTGSRLQAGDAIRPVHAGGRPVLRHRQRGARHLRHLRAVRRGLAGPGPDGQTSLIAAARGPGRRGGGDLRRVRVGLARVRRQGGRHHRHGAVLPAAGHGGGRDEAELAPGAVRRGQRAGPVRRVRADQLPGATGHSDIGVFAGNTLHGHSGGLLLRKINSNLGSLSVNAFSPLIPIVAIVTGLMLWRPAWFRLHNAPLAYAAPPQAGLCCGRSWACCG